MTIGKLTQVSKEVLGDLNRLLTQLRGTGPHGSLSELRDIVGDKKIVMVVAKDEKRIVGVGTLYIMQKIGKRSAHIEDVIVDGEYRGQGLGKKITQALIAAAKAKKVKSLYLTSRPARVAANKLYQKVGFKQHETNVYRMKF